MRRLGQHFLLDRGAAEKIIAALELAPRDTVIEIGAGHGELTRELAELARRGKRIEDRGRVKIIAIEKDPRLVERLREKFSDTMSVEVIEGDALELLPTLCSGFHGSGFKIVGNIPYYITGHLLRAIGGLDPKPTITVITIQKEVAERIVAVPTRSSRLRLALRGCSGPRTGASRGMNRLAASVQFWAEPTIVQTIPRSSFSPPPKVDSATLRLVRRPPRRGGPSHAAYDCAVGALFRQPRKTILNNLAAAAERNEPGGRAPTREALSKTLRAFGIAPDGRPQNLDIAAIIKIARHLF
jgi:16S rRNA (adenine1518-N6/adenine1519-N6)-dimethyltransferase